MDENELLFFGESVRHAQSLSLTECVRFLTGMLAAVGGTHPSAARLRLALSNLTNSDAQLELIALGQLKLPLDEAPRGSRRTR